MKTLVLCRHAKSSWKYHTDDIYRPLNRRGIADAPMMAKQDVQEQPDCILCSPAVRTYSTVLAYVRENHWPMDILRIDNALFNANLKTLLACIKSINKNVNRVWLFGHNPGLNLLAEYLSAEAIDNIVTSGRIHLTLPLKDWHQIEPGNGKIIKYLSPRFDE